MSTPTLYERLGSSEGIEALVGLVVRAHLDNPIIAKRFEPILDDPDRMATTAQHLCYFLEAGTGGPVRYTGRTMPKAHRGMNISAEEYMAAVDDIMGALVTHGADEQTRSELLVVLWSMKGEIMGL